ncbi:unnamed protein product [Victoria cruziana]
MLRQAVSWWPSSAASSSVILIPGMRKKTTSAQSVETRHRDPTFEKLMRHQKHVAKITTIQSLVYANPDRSLPLSFLSGLSQRLRLSKGAPSFLRRFPHVFSISSDQPRTVRFTDAADEVFRQESDALELSKPEAVNRLRRLLSMSATRTLPLRAIFKVWRELGLTDDFEDSVIGANPGVFALVDNPNEPNTHLLRLVEKMALAPVPAVERWRDEEYRKNRKDLEEIRFGFWHGFPPCMRLKKEFRAKTKEWQSLPYWGPYEDVGRVDFSKSRSRSRAGIKKMEKRAVGIVHEFLSLTVEKMVEVEKISQFRKWLRIDLNVRDLFLDHPGMFYLSTKGKTHTIFLREAYDRGYLIDPNPIYLARRKVLDLVMMGRRRSGCGEYDRKLDNGDDSSESEWEEDTA